jgi:predicted RecB family nuclease
MKLLPSGLRLSASDLANHLGCRHLTLLDRGVAQGRIEASKWRDPALQVMAERGLEHEREYLEHLEEQKLEVVRLPEDGSEFDLLAKTLEVMRAGPDVIAQATLGRGRWLGRADVLRRVSTASRLGSYSYEPYDTKLAREARGSAILQLCLYADLLDEVQGLRPERMHVVPPGSGFVPHTFRVHDFLAYYRWVKTRLESAVEQPFPELPLPVPEPVEKCDTCGFWKRCDKERHDADHLALVAGITRLQRRELADRTIGTLEGLANVALPLPWRPRRGSAEALTRSREQARVQLTGRREGRPYKEHLAVEPGRGFALLPEASPGDIFFDIEGDPFVADGGLEYLFGYSFGEGEYRAHWALDREAEKKMFETFVDTVMDGLARDPNMHVYHYAPYEPSALKRLMGRHATRAEEVDRLLRGRVFVDLYSVVRQSLRASVEKYSIKELERFFGFARALPLEDAGTARRVVEFALELRRADEIPAEARASVEAYNKDDCLSARALRDWLETERAARIAAGARIDRPSPGSGDPTDDQKLEREDTRALREKLLAGVPADAQARSAEQQARWLLANILDFHWREEKCKWWEYYRLRELSDEELKDERAGLAGLEFVETVPVASTRKGAIPIHRYRFPLQDTDIRGGDDVHSPNRGGVEGVRIGTIVEVDFETRTVDVKKTKATASSHPTALFAHKTFGTKELAGSLARAGSFVASTGVEGPGGFIAGRDLLLRMKPRLKPAGVGALKRTGETGTEAACRLALELNGGVLPIQGPPGSGKTYTGARMICALVKSGKKVGVTAQGHKVIRLLLDETMKAAAEEKLNVRRGHKIADDDPGTGRGVEFRDNAGPLAALRDGSIDVLGGTAWMWSRPEYENAVDVLVIDEAGQLSLATALAVAPAARSVVLLGDPKQLEQPVQGTHPDGTAVSALQHLLGDAPTISPDAGLFLEETRRLHPKIAAFTSELFYAGRLKSLAGLENQAIVGTGPITEAGLFYLPVEHEGSQSCSPDEVDAVERLVGALLGGETSVVDAKKVKRRLEKKDILIVAPYNAQVGALADRLPNFHIGTVDKFQGQEAPIVIVSMATSSAEDAPRGMEFLYSPNRLNVATSRAQAACILVASPRLFEPDCQTPRQMQLANAFCRFREMASVVKI